MDTDTQIPPVKQSEQYLALLQGVLSITETEVKAVLDDASALIGATLRADKVDSFIFSPQHAALVAIGTSNTPLAQKQRALGLDYLPLAGGGRAVEVYQTGVPYLCGRLDLDPLELAGIKEDLGLRSMVNVPLLVQQECCGVLSVSATAPERYGTQDLDLLKAIAVWVGLIFHRAELIDSSRAAQPASAPRLEDVQRECLRLQAEATFWRETADRLLGELARYKRP
jgi:two-component system, OmpR family, sensor kinase